MAGVRSSNNISAFIGPVCVIIIILVILWKTGKLDSILFEFECRFNSLSRKIKRSAPFKKISDSRNNKELYDKAVSLLETGEINGALTRFERLSKANYKDSNIKLKDCRAAAARIKREKCCEEALKDMRIGRFGDAMDALERISGEDASYKEKYLECCEAANQAAVRYMEKESFGPALDLFKKLVRHKYPGADEKADQCREGLYRSGVSLMSEGKTKDAMDSLSRIPDYKNSRELYSECEKKIREEEYKDIYEQAMECIAAKNDDKALELLEKLPKTYKDTQSIYYELAYEKAVSCMNRAAFPYAMDWFKKLPEGYKDSKSLYHLCIEREHAGRVNIAFESDDELKPSKGHVHHWVEIPGTRVYEIDRRDFSRGTYQERCTVCGAKRTSEFSHYSEDA